MEHPGPAHGHVYSRLVDAAGLVPPTHPMTHGSPYFDPNALGPAPIDDAQPSPDQVETSPQTQCYQAQRAHRPERVRSRIHETTANTRPSSQTPICRIASIPKCQPREQVTPLRRVRGPWPQWSETRLSLQQSAFSRFLENHSATENAQLRATGYQAGQFDAGSRYRFQSKQQAAGFP